jgi:type VI secretion system secreted protein VgrG
LAYTQDNRRIGVATALGKDVVLLSSFEGEEGISRLFRFDLELLSENESIDFDVVVGKNVTFWLVLSDGSQRYINGQISRFSQGARDANFTSYHAEVVPWLWFLTRTADCRIFQNKKAPDIIQQIFTDFGFKDYALRLYGDFVEREYCVQYRETSFNFVSRLMEEEGIFYFFEHENGKHTLVLANSPAANKPCPQQPDVRYDKSPGAWQEDDVILEWRLQQELRPGQYTLTDYDFENPTTDLSANVSGKGTYELYDYPGEYLKRSDGNNRVRIRLQEAETPYTVGYGSSDCRDFISGYKFNMTEHYRGSQNQAYVLTSIHHVANQGGDFRSAADEDFHYRNTFECIPAATPFRPSRLTPEPVIQGAQTAVVVGPAGEEIFTDKYGRVKVQFHWDREGKLDENSSCWIRVSQLWAGKKWGAVYTPRIGQEVIVDFLEGDPDKPIITGRVYNAEQMPPYDLPAEKTKSTIKSYSSQGGGGFNEIRFEDKKGDEQIFVHGEKDLEIRIKNDRKEWIGEDRHLIVTRDKLEQIQRDVHRDITRDQIEQIGRDHHLTINGKEAIKVAGSHSFTVQGDVIEQFQGNHSSQVTQNLYIKGMNVVIEGATELTIMVGGNFININPGGVFITGTMVMINSGGAAGVGMAGSAVSPIAPNDPLVAVDADPGAAGTAIAGSVTRTPVQLDSARVTGPTHDPNSPDNQDKKHWIEIKLVDEDGKPVPGEPYQITLPDGSTIADGTLDEKGFARVDNIDPGTCQVTFPNLDEDSWKPK